MYQITATFLSLCGVLLLMSDYTHAQEKDLTAKWSSVGVIDEIEGTVLLAVHVINSQKSSGWSENSCSIGYRKIDKSGKETIETVLSLPLLKNDRYVINYKDGRLSVKTKSNNKEYVELNLELLAPTAIQPE